MSKPVPIQTKSKRKGKQFERDLRDYLRRITGLGEGDLDAATGCANGCDLPLSPYARTILPLTIEAKNRRDFSPQAYLKQATQNCLPNTRPVAILKNPRKPIGESIVIMRLDDLLGFLGLPNQEDDTDE